MYRLVLLLFATSVAHSFPAPERNQKDGDWVGKSIILRKSSTPFYDNKDVSQGTLNRTDYHVIREEGEKIWVRDMIREGWINKSDAILATEALPFLTEQINANPVESFLFAKRSKAHEHRGEFDAALNDYNEAVRLSPNVSAWVNNRGNLYLKLRKFDKALEDYSHALDLNPTSPISFNNRALANLNLRDYEAAIRDFTSSIQNDPEYAQARVNRANCYREMKRFDLALTDLAEAAKRDTKNASIPNQLAAIYIDRKDYDLAEAQLQHALFLDPRSALAYHHRGSIFRGKKRYQEAIWAFDHSLWLDPRGISALTTRGVCYRELKQYDLAVQDFEAALKLDPVYLQALNGYSLLLSTASDEKFRDGKKAKELAEKLQELTKGKYPEYAATLAAAQAELGDFDAATANLRKAIADKTLEKELLPELNEQLEAYRRKQAWRN